jgi:hypothetical protein
MQEFTVRIVELIIPILALLIPIVAIVAHYVVQPVVGAILRVAEAKASGTLPIQDGRVLALEERLAGLEHALARVEEEQDFQRRLLAGRNDAADQVAPPIRMSPTPAV